MDILALDPIDKLDRELTDAWSQIVTITGDGFEHFSSLNDQIQHDVLYSLENRIRAAREALDAHTDERAKQREANRA